MTLFEAGMDILYGLMYVDRDIDEAEVVEMMKYLYSCGFELNEPEGEVTERPDLATMIMEIGLLGAMDYDNLMRRWQNSAVFFGKNTSLNQQERMIQFAYKMIAADGKILPEETGLLNRLGGLWNIDTGKLITEAGEA